MSSDTAQDWCDMLRFLAAAFWMSCSCLKKAGEETITIIHPVCDKGMEKFLQVKTSAFCNVFEMIVCWFSCCFDMTTETKVWLQNHTMILDLIFNCLTPRVNCIHPENVIFVSKCNDFSFLVVYLKKVLAHPTVNIINALAEGINGAK